MITRLILAFMLMVQSLPGVAGEWCAEMYGSSGTKSVQTVLSDEVPACECCVRGGMGTGACTNSDASFACRCGLPQPELPKGPPSDPKSERLQFVAVVLPALLTLTHPQPVRLPARWSLISVSPKRPANSIQSVLCVWVV